MRALIQRTTGAEVIVAGQSVGRIGKGLVILLGVTHSDGAQDVEFLAAKCANLRVFKDENDKMNLSLIDIGGSALVVSQFTLYGDSAHGRRPGYSEAARPAQAEKLYEAFLSELQKHLVARVEHGIFGANMQLELVNDGPVTLMLESPR